MNPDLIKLITSAFNNVLTGNPDITDEISSYAGSIIFIDLINTKTEITLQIGDAGIELTEHLTKQPDLTIRATPMELVKHFVLVNNNSVPGSGNIEISGNIVLAQTLQSVFVKLDPDWEDKLSEVAGDEISHSLFFIFRKITDHVSHGKKELVNNFAEYIKFENNFVISDTEINCFNESIDQLRDDVEKLNFRINRLNRSIGTG